MSAAFSTLSSRAHRNLRQSLSVIDASASGLPRTAQLSPARAHDAHRMLFACVHTHTASRTRTLAPPEPLGAPLFARQRRQAFPELGLEAHAPSGARAGVRVRLCACACARARARACACVRVPSSTTRSAFAADMSGVQPIDPNGGSLL